MKGPPQYTILELTTSSMLRVERSRPSGEEKTKWRVADSFDFFFFLQFN
jgi:hypothetical protein